MQPVLATFAKGLKPAAWLLLGTGVGVALTVAVQSVAPDRPAQQAERRTDDSKTIELVEDLRLDGSPAMGSDRAPITIVEFSDFECPYCQRFHQQVLNPLQEQYIDTGLVRFVHKDLPLPFHAQADLSARVARCATDDAEYWGIYKRLFERQTCLSCEGPVAIASDDPDQQARLRRCADDPQTRLLVNTDRSEASLHGIRATPTFVIGPTINANRHRGQVKEGAMPWKAFQRLIDEELRKVGHPIDTSTDGR